MLVGADNPSIPSPESLLDPLKHLDNGDDNADSPHQKQLPPCQVCKVLVDSYELGMRNTARGKHEGGDTSWEERNLKNYANSEIRLVEIQEALCEEVKEGKPQCLSLAEDTEQDVESWWFKERLDNVNLHDYLCISKLKRCCKEGSFGPKCQSCPSDCNSHGDCDGSGTRLGTGKCLCNEGYVGELCEDCANDHFRIDASGNQFTCLKCDFACKSCYGLGPMNCTVCRDGYHKNEQEGCVDINECDVGLDADGQPGRVCKGNTYCVNTDGSYKCADCDNACSGCIGRGPEMCLACAPGFRRDDDYVCRSQEQIDQMREWNDEHFGEFIQNNFIARWCFYAGVLCVSLVTLRTNRRVMLTFLIGLIVMIVVSEFTYEDTQEYTDISSE